MLVSLRVAGAGTNIHVVRGALNGFGQNQSNTESILSSKWQDHGLDHFTNKWIIQLCRAVTTSRPVITRSVWNEVRLRYLFKIIDLALKHNILVSLMNQCPWLSMPIKRHPSSYLRTMLQWPRKVKSTSRAGATDKRAITVTLCETLDGQILPFQLIYTGKQNDPCQVLNFLTDFVYLIIQNTGAMRAKHLN